MKSSAQVVVIGGGVVGASVLYHLTKRGLDRRRAARAQAAHCRLDVARGRRHAHAQRRPQRRPPAAVHGQPLPRDRGRVRPELQHPPPRRADAGRHARATRLAAHGRRPRPLPRDAHGPDLDERGQAAQPAARGAVLRRRRSTTPTRASVDPYGVTHAYAICARNRGAEVYTDTWVTALAPAARRHVGRHHRHAITRSTPSTSSTAAGCGRARSAGWSGIELPVLAMEHHYLVTEPMQEVIDYNREHGRELPHMIDFARRDVLPPGGPGDPARHVRAGQQAVVAAARRRGTSCSSCSTTTSTASPPSSSAASPTSPPSAGPASSASSTARSRSAPTATRSSGRSAACAACGSPAR